MPRVSPRRAAPGRIQPNRAPDRPGPWRLLGLRLRRLAKPLSAAGLVLAALLALLGALRAAKPVDTIDSLQTRLGRVVGVRVAEVAVRGRANTPEPMLRAALGVSPGDDLFGFSPDAARRRLERLSWVARATVQRRLPGTVLVTLEERRPFAIWQHEGGFQLIDRAGAVVTGEDLANFAKLPLVVGDADAAARAGAILDLLATQPGLQARVAALVRVGDRRWNLHLASGADVLLPETHEDAALRRLAELQATDSLLDRPLSAVDMRMPDRLVLRPAAKALEKGPA